VIVPWGKKREIVARRYNDNVPLFVVDPQPLFPSGQAGMGFVVLMLAEERGEYFDRGRVKWCVFIVE
jgi:hypothetical protein